MCHIDLRSGVEQRHGCWPLLNGSYTISMPSSIDSASALSTCQRTEVEVKVTKIGVTLLSGCVLHVGGFEFGPFKHDPSRCGQSLVTSMMLRSQRWSYQRPCKTSPPTLSTLNPKILNPIRSRRPAPSTSGVQGCRGLGLGVWVAVYGLGL